MKRVTLPLAGIYNQFESSEELELSTGAVPLMMPRKAIPITADRTDAVRIAILARLSICDVENERSEMNRDIVKPIPPSIALPRM